MALELDQDIRLAPPEFQNRWLRPCKAQRDRTFRRHRHRRRLADRLAILWQVRRRLGLRRLFLEWMVSYVVCVGGDLQQLSGLISVSLPDFVCRFEYP